MVPRANFSPIHNPTSNMTIEVFPPLHYTPPRDAPDGIMIDLVQPPIIVPYFSTLLLPPSIWRVPPLQISITSSLQSFKYSFSAFTTETKKRKTSFQINGEIDDDV